jgi:hypothetical protein
LSQVLIVGTWNVYSFKIFEQPEMNRAPTAEEGSNNASHDKCIAGPPPSVASVLSEALDILRHHNLPLYLLPASPDDDRWMKIRCHYKLRSGSLIALQQYMERLNNSEDEAGKTSVSCIPYVLNIMIDKTKLIMLPTCIRFICSLVME